MTLVPVSLRVEYGPRPLGIGVRRPRLSWWPPAAQLGYQVEAVIDGATHTAAAADDEAPFLRPWPFQPLGSRSRVSWRVRARSDAGWSGWSEAGEFETGLLEVPDWRGRFIGATESGPLPPRGERGAVYFRRRFTVPAPAPARARVYATAHGIYELHLDGTRVGDLELTPGFTAYHSHLEVQAYDVTGLLLPGEHELVATVTDGWWRGATGAVHMDRCYGASLALLAQIEFTGQAGGRIVIPSDGSWQVSADGPVRAADLMEGQRVDQRFPVRGWTGAAVTGEPGPELTVSPAPPARRVQEYRPLSVTRAGFGSQVIDLGANINGWVRLSGAALGQAGNRVRLRHGERLGDDGDVDTAHLGTDIPGLGTVPVGMTDQVTSAGPGAEDFEPRHTTHGFRYVSITGARDLTEDDVTGVMVHTDLRRTGWFSCSDARLNALHEAAVLSFRGNACEIPTDCPTRERAGWTGDWQLFVPAAAFLYDVAGFSARWLRDLAADQWEDGRVPNFVPDSFRRVRNGRLGELTGSAGWGDAAVYVPYQLWQSYGDTQVLADQYESMQAWVEFALRSAAGGRHPARAAARPEPAAHERYLWDTGFHWGEWLEPGADPDADLQPENDKAEVATAYLYRSAATLARVARLLGETGASSHYRRVATQVRNAWQAEFTGGDGTVTPATQANLVRALAFGLVNHRERVQAAADLVKLIRTAGNHLGTGFLATPFLLPALADHGYPDVAYDLLRQTSAPSWLHMIESGATTVWENWEGLDARGKGSLNHYSKGAVISFLHSHVAGLRPLPDVPAWQEFEVRPCPGGGITQAEARLDTPYGPVGAAWQAEEGAFTLHVQVAPGTRARVTLPGGVSSTRGPGNHTFSVTSA
ncbi:MAG TPA: family 78 glycoside hydrolase catalytic domain [Streptosporangiaceae bacterium]|nr:family 78 glycoside hydrolase catalytic domain [Streptosporangiaceae bacterium]